MQIESSLLGPEVDRIINRDQKNNTDKVSNRIIIHTEEYDIPMEQVINVEVLEDYNNNYGEEIFMEVLCPMGDLIKKIYKFRNNLEVSIVKDINGAKEADRYKLILLNIKEEFGSGRYQQKSQQELNEEEMYRLKGQCIDRHVEALRVKNVQGIYRDHTMEEVLVGLFDLNTRQVSVNGQPSVPYVNMVKPDNQRVYKHVMIPSATRLVDLPTLLQELDYGVYNGHIGMYIKRMVLGTPFSKNKGNKELNIFIYPLYRVGEQTTNNKLIIYNVPNIKYSMVENTYLIDGDDIRIISNEDSKKLNKGDDEFMDKGIGYVTLDANAVMNRPVDVGETKVENTKKSNNIENYMKDRSDGVNYRQHKKPSDNHYHLRSDYLKEHGDLIQVKWNFSNTKYLLPGMEVVYTFLGDNNNVIRLNGILQSHYTLYNQGAKMASTILNIFVEKDTNEQA